MLKRLVTGIGKGILLGGLLALLVVRGLGMPVFASAFVAYLAAAATGIVTGLFAGRPIWAKEAKIEAGLKALAGAVLGTVVLFAVRRWLPYEVDLGAWHAGQGVIGALPAASLPLVSMVLATLFDLDNTGEPSSPPKTRVTEPQASEHAPEQAFEDETEQGGAERQHGRR